MVARAAVAHRRGRRLDAVLRIHGNGAVRAGPRLLHDGPRLLRRRGRFRHRAGALAAVSRPALPNGVADVLAKSRRRRRSSSSVPAAGVLAAGLWPRLAAAGCARRALSHRRAEPRARRAPARTRRAGSGARALPRPLRVARGSRRAKPGPGVAIANEVVDALPVDRFRVTRRGLRGDRRRGRRRGLCIRAGAARRARARGGRRVAAAARCRSRCRRVTCPSCGPARRGWLQQATRALARGAMLVVDYGLPRAQYYHASRDGGTLCGFRRHRRVEDPLAAPGTQDLTAWVDFSALADDGARCRARARGLRDAGALPARAGIERRARAARRGRARRRARRASARSRRRCCCPARWASASR